jgi:hypothetical protein
MFMPQNFENRGFTYMTRIDDGNIRDWRQPQWVRKLVSNQQVLPLLFVLPRFPSYFPSIAIYSPPHLPSLI